MGIVISFPTLQRIRNIYLSGYISTFVIKAKQTCYILIKIVNTEKDVTFFT